MLNTYYNNKFYNTDLITNKSNNLINKIKKGYKLFPKESSYRIEDNNVVLLYPHINYDFYTGQDKSFIDLYSRRYNDLYSCCFNKSMFDVFSKQDDKIITTQIEIGDVDCDDITEEECLFFQRFYCRALKDFFGDITLPDMCSCYEFMPEDRVLIKLGIPNSCINNKCKSYMNSTKNNIFDDSVMNDTCELSVCSNLIKLNELNVNGDIKISSDVLNLVCGNN